MTEEEKIKIKELHKRTGEPMMECRKALSQSDGDVEKSIIWLSRGNFKFYLR